MKYLLSFLLLPIVFLFVQPAAAQTSPVPSSVCLGSCPTLPVSPSPETSISPSVNPSNTIPSTTVSVAPSNSPSANPSPSTSPCSTSQDSVHTQNNGATQALHHSHGHKGKKHGSGQMGLLQQFILLLLQFLQLIFKQLGINIPIPTGPCPTPSPSATPTGAPSNSPSSGVSPSAVPSNASTAPSANPSTGVPTPTIFGVSPSPTPKPTSKPAAPTATKAPTTGTTPTLLEEFNPWSGTKSPDGLWQINGNWSGTDGNQIYTSNASLSSTNSGSSGGFLSLSVQPNSKNSGEIQTIKGYGYGYYQVRMKVTSTPGVVVSFFWKQLNYDFGEIDFEFLTNGSWISSANSGVVYLTINGGDSQPVNLPFNPSKDFHTYGFLYNANGVQYDADGKILAHQSFPSGHSSSYSSTTTGYIMMNTWTGNPNWGGGPPTKVATSVYDWVKYYANVTSIPK